MVGPVGSLLFDGQGRRKYLSRDEGQSFLSVAATLDGCGQALCLVLYWTGCRVSEALELGPERIDRDNGRIVVRTLKRHHRRGGVEDERPEIFRAIPVPPEVIAKLDALRAGPDGFWPFGRQAAWRRVKVVMGNAGVAGEAASPKGLRHHFGIMAAEAGIPARLIMRWMGHAKLETTMIYLDAVGGEELEFAQRMWRSQKNAGRSAS